jgi:hypothetical protein
MWVAATGAIPISYILFTFVEGVPTAALVIVGLFIILGGIIMFRISGKENEKKLDFLGQL